MESDDHARTAADDAIGPGTRLNDMFEIDEKIASGGMGEVFRGHNVITDEPVAIKIVLGRLSRDEMISSLFFKEARILSSLNHPSIVRYQVFTVDKALGRPYLVMEYINGTSLAQRLGSGPLSVADVRLMTARVAAGLDVAHAAGVIHRDMSPDNILLVNDNVSQPKIIDFGIARSTQPGNATLLSGQFAGRENFASPEQFGLYGGVVEAPSDVYSLALVVANALKGDAIDMMGTQYDMIQKRMKVPDLGHVDAELRPLLEEMLIPDPAKRHLTMQDVANYFSGTVPLTSLPRSAEVNASWADEAPHVPQNQSKTIVVSAEDNTTKISGDRNIREAPATSNGSETDWGQSPPPQDNRTVISTQPPRAGEVAGEVTGDRSHSVAVPPGAAPIVWDSLEVAPAAAGPVVDEPKITSRRRWPYGVAAALVVLLAGGVAAFYLGLGQPKQQEVSMVKPDDQNIVIKKPPENEPKTGDEKLTDPATSVNDTTQEPKNTPDKQPSGQSDPVKDSVSDKGEPTQRAPNEATGVNSEGPSNRNPDEPTDQAGERPSTPPENDTTTTDKPPQATQNGPSTQTPPADGGNKTPGAGSDAVNLPPPEDETVDPVSGGKPGEATTQNVPDSTRQDESTQRTDLPPKTAVVDDKARTPPDEQSNGKKDKKTAGDPLTQVLSTIEDATPIGQPGGTETKKDPMDDRTEVQTPPPVEQHVDDEKTEVAIAQIPQIDPVLAKRQAWLDNFKAGDCVYSRVTPNVKYEVNILSVATSFEPAIAMDPAFHSKFGFEAHFDARKIDERQCAAIGLLNDLRQAGIPERQLVLSSGDSDTVKSGQPITGSIDGLDSANTVALLIDHDGLVYNVSDSLRKDAGGKASLSIERFADKNQVRLYKLLVVLGSDLDLPVTFPKEGRAAAVNDIMPELIEAARRRPPGLEYSYAFFMVDPK